jgi:hypothetical protein
MKSLAFDESHAPDDDDDDEELLPTALPNNALIPNATTDLHSAMRCDDGFTSQNSERNGSIPASRT